MHQDRLEEFGAYAKGMELFDFVVEDMQRVRRNPLCFKLVPQQVGAADSICANIEEGYGRRTTAEYVNFLVIARGSAREALGRYRRMHHWIRAEVVAARVGLCNEIIGILTSTINRLDKRRPR